VNLSFFFYIKVGLFLREYLLAFQEFIYMQNT